jgi:arsenate reductase-like glutaredoxin family protein
MRLTTRDTVKQARELIANGDHEFRIFDSRGVPIELQDLERILESLPARSTS